MILTYYKKLHKKYFIWSSLKASKKLRDDNLVDRLNVVTKVMTRRQDRETLTIATIPEADSSDEQSVSSSSSESSEKEVELVDDQALSDRPLAKDENTNRINPEAPKLDLGHDNDLL